MNRAGGEAPSTLEDGRPKRGLVPPTVVVPVPGTVVAEVVPPGWWVVRTDR